MDIAILGAIIKNPKMIEDVISSLPEYDYHQKFILFDGIPEKANKLQRESYIKYMDYIERTYPSWKVLSFNQNVYYREMLKYLVNTQSQADKILVIQDDVTLNSDFNLHQIEKDWKNLPDCKMICFHHIKHEDLKQHHWITPISEHGDYVKSHGFTERVFLIDRVNVAHKLDNEIREGNRNKRFFEQIYHNFKNTKTFHNMNDKQKEEYWKTYGCYYHKNIIHNHLVGKRLS